MKKSKKRRTNYKLKTVPKKNSQYKVDVKPFSLPRNTNIVGRLVLFSSPLLLSFGGLVYIKIYTMAAPAGLQLSPAQTQPMALALVIFMVGYLMFLAMMFSDQLKSAWMEIRRKWLH